MQYTQEDYQKVCIYAPYLTQVVDIQYFDINMELYEELTLKYMTLNKANIDIIYDNIKHTTPKIQQLYEELVMEKMDQMCQQERFVIRNWFPTLKHKTPKLYTHAIRIEPYLFYDIKRNDPEYSNYMTPVNLQIVLMDNYDVSRYISKEIWCDVYTEEFCLKMIRQNPYCIDKIPEELITKEMFDLALELQPDLVFEDQYMAVYYGNSQLVAVMKRLRDKFYGNDNNNNNTNSNKRPRNE